MPHPGWISGEAPITYYLGDEWIGQYDVDTFRGGLDLGVQGRLGELRAGFFQGKLKTDGKFGILSVSPAGRLVPEYDLRQGGFMGRLALDQLDNANFPATGFSLMGNFFVTNEAFGAEDNYNKYELTFQKPFNIDRHTLTLGLVWADSPDSKLPAYDLFQTGGFQRFSGYVMDQLVGDSYYMGRLVYTYRFADLPSPLGRGIYLGGSLEAGEVRNRFDPTTAGGTLYCGSLFFSGGHDPRAVPCRLRPCCRRKRKLLRHAGHRHAVMRMQLFFISEICNRYHKNVTSFQYLSLFFEKRNQSPK